MKKIAADWIYPVSDNPLQDHLIVLDDEDVILAIDKQKDHDPGTFKKLDGILLPGFINAHCHLELSHLLGVSPTGTGLLPFLLHVIRQRERPDDEILQAIADQDHAMWDQGIQAVGDICNTHYTSSTKAHSLIRYHSFIEMYDLFQEDQTDVHFNRYLKVFESMHLKPGDKKSVVPHAPYTVSIPLFNKIKKFNQGLKDISVSIHNQETPAEDQLFMTGQGPFIPFYATLGLSIDPFAAIADSSIHYSLAHMDPSLNTLLVHNTLTPSTDVQFAHLWSPNVYWVSCPNANLYIENKLPNYQNLLSAGAKICLGTDSLTSNWQLSILEEIKTIKKYQSGVRDEQLLRWATLHGAQALGFDDHLGSIEVGKSPGILLLESSVGDGLNFSSATIKRII